MILTPQELKELTQRERPSWQARVLEKLQIPFRRRPDGTLVVLRSEVETVLSKPRGKRARR